MRRPLEAARRAASSAALDSRWVARAAAPSPRLSARLAGARGRSVDRALTATCPRTSLDFSLIAGTRDRTAPPPPPPLPLPLPLPLPPPPPRTNS